MSQTLRNKRKKVYVNTKSNIEKRIGTHLYPEVEKCIRESKYSYTVKGSNFIYFCFNPVSDGFSINLLYKNTKISTFEVINLKGITAGYLVIYNVEEGVPSIQYDNLGVSIFYTENRTEYPYLPKILFSDKKFRLVCLGNKHSKQKDFFCSVKWKSTNVEEVLT